MRKRPLGKHVIKQERVVKWHATITQIEDSVNHLVAKGEDLNRTGTAVELNDILADLGKLRGDLPAIQEPLPFK